MSKYLIPSIEHIKDLCNEVIPLLEKLKTKTDVIEFGKKYKVTMEINYDLAKLFDESEPIEVIRCESWGDLSYVYVYTNGDKPHFDVWCDFMDCEFIEEAYIENIEKYYIQGVRELWLSNKSRPEDLKELVNGMQQHGISSKEMIDVYGFDKDVVEDIVNLTMNK